jgi:hypothetical protein
MLVIPVNRVLDMKLLIGKMESRGGGKAPGVAGPSKVEIHRYYRLMVRGLS